MNCSVCCEHHNVSTSFFSVFPAGAGVIPPADWDIVVTDSFPRRCGGDPHCEAFRNAVIQFSPQVRG